jgi:hypothetical protein
MVVGVTFLIGQTWSTFMDLNHLGELNAFGLHASTISVRQTQIRFTQPFNTGSFMFSIENPEDGDDDQDRPDLVARVNFKGEFGKVSLGVLSRELSDGAGNTSSETGYSLTGHIPIFGKDDIKFQYNNSNLGRYMGLATYPDTTGVSTSFTGFEATGFSIAYRHLWTPILRSTVMYSETKADDIPVADAIESSKSTHINLIWSVNPKLLYGIEYSNWEVQSSGRAKVNELDVIQLSARYLF